MQRQLIKPITPDYIKGSFEVPQAVIAAVNDLISNRWDGKQSKIFQSEIVSLAITKDNTLTSNLILQKALIDVEYMYENIGWKVTFYTPVLGQSFQKYLIFS